jgi:hypothetical protein
MNKSSISQQLGGIIQLFSLSLLLHLSIDIRSHINIFAIDSFTVCNKNHFFL